MSENYNEILESGPSLELLTDEAIIDYTTDENGRQRVLTDHRDANLKYKPFRPYIGGTYDADFFGSPFIDQCMCGKLHQASDQPCPVCGCRVYTLEEALRRFARIELPFYYLNELRFDLFKEFFDDIFRDCKYTLNFATPDLKSAGYSQSKNPRKLGIKVFDSCQFEYNKKEKELVISEYIDDESKCSYEGILKILEENFPDKVPDYKQLINRLYLVQPAVMRPFTVSVTGGKKSLVSPRMSVWYGIIIRLCCVEDKEAKKQNYAEVMAKFKTPGERVRYTALLRALLNVGKKEATDLLNTSKENLSRLLYSVRTKNSARCPIIPSTTLKIDEVSIPVHLAYEMCRSGFIKYLQDKLGWDEKDAKRSSKYEYDNPKIKELFKEYAEKQYVINNSYILY